MKEKYRLRTFRRIRSNELEISLFKDGQLSNMIDDARIRDEIQNHNTILNQYPLIILVESII